MPRALSRIRCTVKTALPCIARLAERFLSNHCVVIAFGGVIITKDNFNDNYKYNKSYFFDVKKSQVHEH